MDQQDFWDDFQHLKREAITLRDSVARLNLLRGRFRALMEAGNVFVAYLDREGRILEVSQAGLKLLGLEERDVIDRLHVGVFQDEQARRIGTVAAEVIRQKEPATFEWSLRRTDGPSLTLQCVAAPVRDETGTVVAACVTASIPAE